MRNLLATDFMRLWKSKAFWGCFAAGIFMCLATTLGDYHYLQVYQDPKPLDEVFFNNIPLMGLLLSACFWEQILAMARFGIKSVQGIKENRFTCPDGWFVYQES